MKLETTPGWSVFKQIFHDHWKRFQRHHSHYDRAYYDEVVEKMLACGNPKQIGYTQYRCLDCGQGQHVVPMSCKSALCLRCAKVYVDDFVSKVSRQLRHSADLQLIGTTCLPCPQSRHRYSVYPICLGLPQLSIFSTTSS